MNEPGAFIPENTLNKNELLKLGKRIISDPVSSYLEQQHLHFWKQLFYKPFDKFRKAQKPKPEMEDLLVSIEFTFGLVIHILNSLMPSLSLNRNHENLIAAVDDNFIRLCHYFLICAGDLGKRILVFKTWFLFIP